MPVLDGRVVIVTGAGRGLGRAHALELARAGATVVVNDLGVSLRGEDEPGPSPAESVVSEIEAMGGTASADGTSVTDWDGIESLVARVVDRYGHLDAVVNNAGFLRDKMLTSMSESDFDDVLQVHVKGTFVVTRHACAHWRAVAKAGGTVSGRIVNTTSGAGLWGNVGQANYGAAKAAIAGMTLADRGHPDDAERRHRRRRTHRRLGPPRSGERVTRRRVARERAVGLAVGRDPAHRR